MRLLPALGFIALVCAAAASGNPITLERRAAGTISVKIASNQAMAVQCQNGQWSTQANWQISVSVNGLAANQPMAETGLATIDSLWFLDGAPATVKVNQAFSLQNSVASGNKWTFQLIDDGPNAGGQLALGACTQGAKAPVVSVSFSSNTVAVGQGFNNIPAVSAIPTIVNALQAANIATGGTASTAAAAPSATPSPSAAAKTNNNAGTTTTTTGTNPQIVFSVNSANAITVSCNNGQWSTFLGLHVAVTIGGVTGLVPMGETGLPVIDMAFFLDGKAATLGTPNTFNAKPSTTSGNVWSFGLQDDIADIGGGFQLGACTNGQAAPVVTASFSSKTFINGQGFDNPKVPALSGIPTIVNGLAAVNVAKGTGATNNNANTGTTAKASATPTPSPSAAAKTTGTTTGSIVFTIANDPGQNGGQGINGLRCNNGQIQTTVNLLASVNINNIHSYQPMGETGLPTIDMAFFVGGKAAAVTVQNSFNVAASTTSGNVWSFTLQDDGPHPGGQLSLGACTGTTVPQVTASFSTKTFIVGQGLPNGADGGPPVPAVSGIPTIVNGLPAQFVAGATTTTTTTNNNNNNNNGAATAKASASPSPSAAAKTTGASTGSIVFTFKADPGQNGGQGINGLVCRNGQIQTTINMIASVNINNIADYQPMGETGLPVIDMAFFVGGKAAQVTVQNAFNVASSAAAGNVWSFGLQDDGPHPGGQLMLGACTAGAAIPQVTATMSTKTFIVGQGLPNGADGGPAVPAVSGVPTIVNQLPSQFQATFNVADAGSDASMLAPMMSLVAVAVPVIALFQKM